MTSVVEVDAVEVDVAGEEEEAGIYVLQETAVQFPAEWKNTSEVADAGLPPTP